MSHDYFAALGGSFVEPRVVIDAALPLELSGEAVRGRICVFTDEAGREWALRPDLTLPVAVDEVARRLAGAEAEAEQVVRYAAPVFRLPALAGEPVEFLQAGFERFGASSDAQADADVFAAIAGACADLGHRAGRLQVGDLSVFPAFVDTAGLAPDTASGLKRAFRQEGGVRAFLSGQRAGAASGLAQRMRGMKRDEIAAFVEDIFALTGVRPVGERTGEEIVERLHARAESSRAVEVAPPVQAMLEAVLAVDCPLGEAVDALRAIARDLGSTSARGGLDRVLDGAAHRHEAILRAAGGFAGEARFATRFGRRFTYYDGFVFEMAAHAQTPPFAAGGRYDSLLANLSGGAVNATAVGGIIIPHRLVQATGDLS